MSTETDLPALAIAIAPHDAEATQGHNVVSLDTFDLKIYLLDHAGKRMGANPQSRCPVEQIKGTVYRLSFLDGETRLGHATPEGALEQYGLLLGAGVCELMWGRQLTERWEAPPAPDDLEAAEDYYLYKATLRLQALSEAADRERMLKNLGYAGDDGEGRFASHYGSADAVKVADVHENGRERSA